MQAVLAGRTSLNASVITFHITPAQPLPFLAGQYIELILPHDTDNRGDRRWFTISNAPSEPTIDLTMRLRPYKASSFKRHLASLPNGASVELGEVLGDFVAPKLKRTPLIFIADGIGITPFISMVRDLAKHHDLRDIQLYHSVRQTGDYLFHDELAAYGVTLHKQVQTTGQLVPQNLQSDVSDLPPNSLYYLAGSEDRCLAIQHYLRDSGVQPRRIALDYFSGYPQA